MSADLFPRMTLGEPLAIKRLISLHYFEFAPTYVFDGEQHDFWEMCYVDKGELGVYADGEGYRLKQGDMIFHRPDEFHSLWAISGTAPNVVVVAFECASEAAHFFERRLVTLGARQREMLAQMMQHGYDAFKPPFDEPFDHKLTRRADAPLGAEQLFKIHLEMLLLDLLHSGQAAGKAERRSGTVRHLGEESLVRKIIALLEERVEEDLKLDAVCHTFNLSKNHALALFKAQTGQSIMRYFRNLKQQKARQLIREGRLTFTEIAARLQYGSVHSFSRQFRTATGMSPTEYLHSIQSKVR
ncbi:helix-turn-helix transcriptional regulator [Paenibacillus sp. IB182496]|uniref:Helix-turn-helix transcriptional regulator n=1 Tax=Paenibacillus sabuli TaxID=2772509 RepID=A0A927BR66_9BACL|nr:AraC family transcriptional regulator [Paenibacillus sabuli]MBD2844762.1 helix-turn-helix transcriptional regulator [Paenibacillus sabuli]